MSRFKELNDNLMKILETLLSSQDLCKLLYYTNDNPLEQPDIQDTTSLLFNKIYPYPFTPNVQDEATSIINVVLTNFRLNQNRSFKDGEICFNILCHINLWKISGGLRPYSILKEIDELFNGERIVGIGKLEYKNNGLLWANEKYCGYSLVYRINSIN